MNIDILQHKCIGNDRFRKFAGREHISKHHAGQKSYLKAIEEAGLVIPYNFIVESILSREKAAEVAASLLALENRPDAFFTVSDYQSLGVLQVAEALNISVPEQLRIFGFANEVR